jgi:hypothetical protein
MHGKVGVLFRSVRVYRLVALVVTGASLAIASPSYAWQDEEPVVAMTGDHPRVVVEPDGTTDLFYPDRDRGTIEMSKRPGQALGAPHAITDDHHFPIEAAIDAHGTTHLLVQDRSPSWGNNYGLAVMSRPAGGDWTEPDPIPDSAPAWAYLAVNRDGDVGVLLRRFDKEQHSENYYAAFRPRGEHFGPPLYMGPVPNDYRNETVALTSDGALILLYEVLKQPEGWPQQVYAISRTADEPAAPAQLLSNGDNHGYAPQLATDDHGRAVALWTEDLSVWEVPDWGPIRAFMATRPAGGPWGERTAVPTMNAWVNRVAMAPDGRITIAGLNHEVDILSAPFGEPLKAEKHADVQYASPDILLASSPGGRTLFNWSPSDTRALAMVGDADGSQGPMRDVLPGCGEFGGYGHRVGAVNDSGDGAIVFRRRNGDQWYVATHDADDPAPAHECIDHPPFYGRDMEPPLQPWTPPVPHPAPWGPDVHGPDTPPPPTPPDGPPPGGDPPHGPPGQPPVGPPPIDQYLPHPPPIGQYLPRPLQLRRGSARVTKDGKTVLARVVASCAPACSVQVKPTLNLGRGWRLSGQAKRARLRANGGPVTIKWKLPAAARRMVRQRRSAARLLISAVASDAAGKRTKRTIALRLSR